MKISRSALLRACLLAPISIVSFAQTEPVIFEAEDPAATRGSTMITGTDGTVTWVETSLNDTNPPAAPGTGNYPQKVGVYTVTFPAPGTYWIEMLLDNVQVALVPLPVQQINQQTVH